MIGVIGLGRIGGGVAAALRRGGWSVVGCDVRVPADPPGGVELVDTPTAVAARARIILVAVLDDTQVRTVLDGDDGLLSAPAPPDVVVVLSTVALDTLTWAAQAAEPSGVAIVDCGVSGGVAAAAQGRLVAMVGGDEATVDRVRPVIDAFSTAVIHAGPLGAGMRLKLARNLVTYGSWLVADEAARLVVAGGGASAALAEAIRASDPMTGGTTALLDGDRSRRPPPDALSEIAHKDLRAALELAGASGLDMPAAELTDRRIDEVVRRAATDEEER